MRALFENVIVEFDLHLHPMYLDNYYIDLFYEVSEACYGMFDSEDWYIDGFDEDTLTTTIRNRTSSVVLYMKINADLIDENDVEYLAVDIFIDNEPIHKLNS